MYPVNPVHPVHLFRQSNFIFDDISLNSDITHTMLRRNIYLIQTRLQIRVDQRNLRPMFIFSDAD